MNRGLRLALPLLLWPLCGAAQTGVTEPSAVRTEGEVVIDGEEFAYVAEASRLPIRHAESGELRGHMFHVSYLAPEGGPSRPVMFSWGGGPSGPALEMNLTYGPLRIDEDGTLVDNQLSLLPVADLVFVDPVGTGFSRPARPEFTDEFFGTRGDARAMAEFIRVWVAGHGAEHRPIILNGHSYGVWRAAIAAEILEQSGRHVTALILTSGGMGLGDEFSDPETRPAFQLPDYAATAAYHGRLPASMGTSPESAWQAAEQWARTIYAPALQRLDSLAEEERNAVASELARRTGLPEEAIDRDTLTIAPPGFRTAFLEGEENRLDIFDMRYAGDARLGGETPRTKRARARFLRETLGFKTDLAYQGLEVGYWPVTEPEFRPIGWRWSYDTGDGQPPTGGGPPGREPWVSRTLALNPAMAVFVEAGVYDSLNSCAANEERRRRMPAETAAQFTLRCYFAGHGAFRDSLAHPLLVADMKDFIRDLSP